MKGKYSNARIIDEFSDLPVSRQRKYQLRQQKAGKCIRCGRPRCSPNYCLDHWVAEREAHRRRTGAAKRLRSKSYRMEEMAKRALKQKRRGRGRARTP